MIELYTPTVLCLQEVKHPFPANAGNHVVRVNSFDKTALIRYSEDESSVDILKKLSVSNRTPMTTEIRNFLENKNDRSQVKYLEKVFKNSPNVGAVDYDDTLNRISRLMGAKPSFSPALDKTLRNAIISKQGNIYDHLTLHTSQDEEV